MNKSEPQPAPPGRALTRATPIACLFGIIAALVFPAGSSPCSAASDRFQPVDSLMSAAVADSVFPGAVLLISKNGRILYHKPVGRLGYGEADAAVSRQTVYDLASLTKVVATTTAVMQLVEKGALGLDDPVQRWLPGFVGPGKEKVTLRHLLTHSSGLPPFRRYFLEELRPGEIVARMLAEPLEYAPGTESRYSDIGMILAAKMVEQQTGLPLDRYCSQAVFGPLGMHDTMFNPPPSWLSRIAPTELDRWRGRVLRGAVHDENAFALGGVAGHAGLFSTAGDLAVFLQMLLDDGRYEQVEVLRKETVARFIRRQDLVAESTRALGWDTRSAEHSSSGHLMSMRAFGHTGFTGTSIWVDPELRVFVILLSNRVHPTRENQKIRAFRPLIHDAALRICLTLDP